VLPALSGVGRGAIRMLATGSRSPPVKTVHRTVRPWWRSWHAMWP